MTIAAKNEMIGQVARKDCKEDELLGMKSKKIENLEEFIIAIRGGDRIN